MKLTRTELKFLISFEEYHQLKQQLRLVMFKDIHGEGENNEYLISSLYLEDMYDSHTLEKADGVEYHRKFRLRRYASSDARLEFKTKAGNLTGKQSRWVEGPLYDAIIARDYQYLYQFHQDPLIEHLLVKMKMDDLKPAIYVDYLREAYTYPQGDVRITFDKSIEGRIYDRPLMKRMILEPREMILEVKYTEIIPEFIRKIVFYKKLQALSYSKYYMSWLALII